MRACLSGLLIALCLTLSSGAHAVSLDGGADLFGGNSGGLPSVDEAIRVSAQADWPNRQILASFALIDHVYLYQQRLAFTLLDAQGKVIRHFPLPDLAGGVVKNDPLFGRVTVFYNLLDVALPVKQLPDGPARLKIDYQGCIEDTLCYPPESRVFELAAPAATLSADALSAGTRSSATAAADTPAIAPGTPTTATPATPDAAAATAGDGFVQTLLSQDASAFNDWIRDQDLALVLALFFLGGILLAFTPCVFPMLPILSGIIAGEKTPSARRGFLLSSAYVLGMAVPYTLAGLLVALFGAGLNLQFLLQQPAAIITSAVIFVLLALSMFGLYELQLPEPLRSRLSNSGPRRGGGLAGAALLGAISALVVSPCVTPILAGALIYVAGSGDALTGALSLFALALGMGAPLILVGTGGGHLLPRAGQWMDGVKRFFGVVMLGVALWLLGRLLDDVLVLALYGLLLLIYGVQLGALEPTPDGGSRLRRALALVLTLYGAMLLVGAGGGARDLWQPLAPFSGNTAATATPAGTGTAQAALPGRWQTLHGSAALADALARSADAGRPVLVDFFAEWCVACKELEEQTLSHPQVLQAMQGFDLYRVDITAITPDNQAIMDRYNIFGLPCLMFLDRAGQRLREARILGMMEPQRFLEHLDGKVLPHM